MIRRMMCYIGWHRWIVIPVNPDEYRWNCTRCGIIQGYDPWEDLG